MLLLNQNNIDSKEASSMKKKTESEPMTAEEQKIRGLIGRPTQKELERMYLDIWEENKSLKQQLDGKLEESKEYQSMVKRLRDEAQLKQIAVNQLNRLKEKYDKLKTSTDENSQKLTEATLEHDEKDTADKVEILSLREQLEAKDKEIDRLKQALNNNQTELDASVIAQKALKSDLEATQRELQVIKQETVKSQKNPFGAGRKREHTEQLEKIMELHAQGLSHRAISEIVKVPSATVGRYIKQVNHNNIDA